MFLVVPGLMIIPWLKGDSPDQICSHWHKKSDLIINRNLLDNHAVRIASLTQKTVYSFDFECHNSEYSSIITPLSKLCPTPDEHNG